MGTRGDTRPACWPHIGYPSREVSGFQHRVVSHLTLTQITAEAAADEGCIAQVAVRSTRPLPVLGCALSELILAPNTIIILTRMWRGFHFLPESPFCKMDILNTNGMPIVKNKTSAAKRE